MFSVKLTAVEDCICLGHVLISTITQKVIYEISWKFFREMEQGARICFQHCVGAVYCFQR